MNTHTTIDPAEQPVDDSNAPAPHPGPLIRETLKLGFGKSISAAAPLLGVTREYLNLMLLGATLSRDLAYRLEALTGMDAEMLIGMQLRHDLQKEAAERAAYRRSIARLEPVAQE